jgi:hypothetical protein
MNVSIHLRRPEDFGILRFISNHCQFGQKNIDFGKNYVIEKRLKEQ